MSPIDHSPDLHADAMRAAEASLPELAHIGRERKGEVDTDEIDRFNRDRRRVLAGLASGAAGGLFAGLLASPARADTALDVQILQTASSLEALAVMAYDLVLGAGPTGAIAAFAAETRRRHGEHRRAFQAQTTALDPTAKVQDSPNPKFLSAVTGADLGAPEKLVDLAARLEKVATDTYLLNLAMLQDGRTRSILASVMGVEAQHLATLRTIGALLQGGTPHLVAVPFPASSIMALPQAAGSVAFPDALHQVAGADLIAEPTSGAVR
jgi:hypothetical protein